MTGRTSGTNRLQDTTEFIPISALIDPFTLLEFEAGLPDILFFDANRSALMISGDDPDVANYAEHFEELLEDALSAEESIKLMRNVADIMSQPRYSAVALDRVPELAPT
jgi:hypothetical protein